MQFSPRRRFPFSGLAFNLLKPVGGPCSISGCSFCATRPGLRYSPAQPFFSQYWDLTCLAMGCAMRWTRACEVIEVHDERDSRKSSDPRLSRPALFSHYASAYDARYYWDAVQSAVRNQKRLLNAARAAGVQVIYTRIATQTRTARDVGKQHLYVNLAVPKDSVDAEILPDIAPLPDDIVLSKTSSSPFNSSNIHQLLHNLDVDTLLVCGVVTNGCVESTVRDASDLGYNVILIPDACAAVTPALHQAAITNLNNAFCNCRDTELVVRELEDAV